MPSAAYQDILERSPRGEGQHGSETSPLPDGGPGQTLLKVRHGIRLPCRSIPKPEHHGRMSDKMASRPLRPATATKRAGCRVAPVFPPGVVRVPAPPTSHSLPASPKRSSSAWIASRPAAYMPPALSKRMPDGSASSSQKGPFPSFQSYSSALEASTREKERKKTLRPSPLPSIPPSSSPAVWHALFQTAARQRRGLSPRPEEKFFQGWGEHERGRGSFYKKRPFPSRHPPAPQPNKKAGQSPAPAFTGKTKERRCTTSCRRCA